MANLQIIVHFRSLLLICFLLNLFATSSLRAQYRNPTWIDYISRHKEMAMEQQEKYRIPASITLAQGILESAAGASRLAVQANNHFGIKCHDWKGPSIRHTDDAPNECFRKYRHVGESYEDHSVFLTTRPWYKPLFSLNIRDYRGWAYGLKKAGYATDPNYPGKLITIIENYELYEFDLGERMKRKPSNPQVKDYPSSGIKINPHQVFVSNDKLYIVARMGDDMTSIARELGFNPKKLASFNEIAVDYPLDKGDIIYLQKKGKKAVNPYFRHIVGEGDSMHSIAQRYNMQIKYLYKLNKLPMDYMPEPGNILRLR